MRNKETKKSEIVAKEKHLKIRKPKLRPILRRDGFCLKRIISPLTDEFLTFHNCRFHLKGFDNVSWLM